MRALLITAAAAAVAAIAPIEARAAEFLHCYQSVPPEGVEIVADTSSGDRSMQVAAELQFGVQPILGPKTLCGQLQSLDQNFVAEFLERHDCSASSDVGALISDRLDPSQNPPPAFFVELEEKYPQQTTAFCAAIEGLTLPTSAILDDDAALDAWTAEIGRMLDEADAILDEIRDLEAQSGAEDAQ